MSSPRSASTNSSITSNPAFGQLYSCQINFNSLSMPCDALLANHNWSDSSGLAVTVDSEGNKVVGMMWNFGNTVKGFKFFHSILKFFHSKLHLTKNNDFFTKHMFKKTSFSIKLCMNLVLNFSKLFSLLGMQL